MEENNQIPTQADWDEIEPSLDLKYAYKIFFGKSNHEVQRDFARCVIERADELRYMSGRLFQYYIMGFRQFVTSGQFEPYDAADAASCFLSLVEYKIKNQPADLLPILPQLLETIHFIRSNQSIFNTNPLIDINFIKKSDDIRKLVEGLSNSTPS